MKNTGVPLQRLRFMPPVTVCVIVLTALTVSTAGAQVPDSPPYSGTVTVNATASGGTQQQNVVTGLGTFGYETGLEAEQLRGHTRLRVDLGYSNAEKAGQPRITTAEMLYGEVRQSFDAAQLASVFHGAMILRSDGTETTWWLYGIASGYHHIAFGLNAEEAFGVGLSHDVRAIPGLAIAADIRHIHESFDGQDPFSSWAVRLHESYSYSWVVSNVPTTRTIVLGESVEAVPAFASSDALQVRTLVTLALPIINRFSLSVGFGSDYLRNAAPTFKPHYWKTTVGLQYTYGAQ